MAAATTYLFIDDKAHAWNTGVTVTASGTSEGAAENVRDTTFGNYWKPPNTAGDHWLQFTGPSQGWLGTTGGDDIACVVSYDARGTDQNQIRLFRESAEGTGTWSSDINPGFTVSKLGQTSDYFFFNLSSSGRTSYRLYQLDTDRDAGNVTAKIFNWAMYPVSGWFDVEATLDLNVSPHPHNWASNTGVVASPGGFLFTQRRAATQQDFLLNMKRTQNKSQWSQLVDKFQTFGGSARNFYMQFEGLKNFALLDFSMVHVNGARWSAGRPYVDAYDISIPITTEAHQ